MEITETLACNVHNVWARSRISTGWRWGVKLDDDQKLHPNLVPYTELPESEKTALKAEAAQRNAEAHQRCGLPSPRARKFFVRRSAF